MKYSVIIPSYNSQTTIEKCLSSLSKQDIGQEFETILVDSSEDNTPEIIREKFPWVDLTHLPQKTDQGTARNLGVKKAKGEIIFFLDSDCTVNPNWMSRMLYWHDKGYQAVGGPVINGNPEALVSRAGYFLEFNDLLPYDESKNKETWHVGSCNASYKREVIKTYGSFPAPLKYALEDMLYNWYLSKQGIKMYFDQSIIVNHHHRITWSAYYKHQYKLGHGTVQMLRKTDMEGSWLVRHPLAATFIWPLITFVKLFRTSRTVYKWQPKILRQKPLVIPLMFTGILCWIYGFAKELYFGEKKLYYKRGEAP